VANKLGTSRKNVSRWECGETFPSPYYRELLCQLFELDAQALDLLPPSLDDHHTEEGRTDKTEPPPTLSFSQYDDPHLFVGREALLHNVLHHLQPGSSLALTGLPGIGKTALLGKLLHNPQIQERFSDGVIWVELGPTPDIPRRLAWIARLMGFPMTTLAHKETDATRSHLLVQFLREEFSMRRFLIVLDDVWSVESALPFLIRHPSVSYILTTRLPQVGFTLASREPFVVPPLTFEENHQLLTSLAPAITTLDKALQERVIEVTGGLPLASMLIGKDLALHSYGGHFRRLEVALNHLREPGYRLNLSYPLLPANAPSTQNDDKAISLDSAIGLSYQYLPDGAKTALGALSVLPTAPESFSEEAALAITNSEQEVLDQLVNGGLLEPIEQSSFRIHPIIADYAQYHLKENEPQIRLVRYMEKMCVDHKTNIALLEREYSTLLAGLNTASMLKMHKELLQGVFALIPLMRTHGETRQADHYLRKALHIAIEQQDQALCQKILFQLATFAQLRQDRTQSTTYQSLGQTLEEQQENQDFATSHLIKIQKMVKEQADTPRHYTL